MKKLKVNCIGAKHFVVYFDKNKGMQFEIIEESISIDKDEPAITWFAVLFDKGDLKKLTEFFKEIENDL